MKSEFTLAFNEITERFGLSRDTVMGALESAMVSAYRRSVNASSAQEIEARIESDTGQVQIFAEKEVVEEVENPLTEVTLEEARKYDAEAEVGGVALVDSTPQDFGRVAAQTAKQVILQRLREAERDAQYEEFSEREGDMLHGTVHSITPQAVTIGLGRAEAILPRNQQIPGERFHVRDRVRIYVLEVRKSSRGPVIVVSRTHPNMLRRLLEMEVPEINQGLVEVKAISREAGKRAKVAVAATRDGVDPVGACVGLRGVRIQSIVRDLNDEKIDVIEWNPDPATFIAKALSPARVSGVFLDDNLDRGRTALVVVPEDQLSLAIGRAGVNARLAARLTNWRIDIKSLIEAASESLHTLSSDASFAEMAAEEAEVLPQVEAILAKKEETRPVTPEEYNLLTDFVVRVQTEEMARRDAARRERLQQLEEIRDRIPTTAYHTGLEEVGLSTRVFNLLSQAEYQSAGQVLEQLGLDEDVILALDGVGPKAMEEIERVLNAFAYPAPPVEVEEVAEPAEAAEQAEAEVEAVLEEAAEADAAAVDEGIEPQAVAQAAAEAQAEEEAAAESEEEPIPAPELVPEVQEQAAISLEIPIEAAPETLQKAFDAMLETVGETIFEEEEEEEEGLKAKQPAKKKKKPRTRIVEYDPELGQTVVRHRRKASRQAEWDEFEEFEYDE